MSGCLRWIENHQSFKSRLHQNHVTSAEEMVRASSWLLHGNMMSVRYLIRSGIKKVIKLNTKKKKCYNLLLIRHENISWENAIDYFLWHFLCDFIKKTRHKDTILFMLWLQKLQSLKVEERSSILTASIAISEYSYAWKTVVLLLIMGKDKRWKT